jgi:hypothetical protein
MQLKKKFKTRSIALLATLTLLTGCNSKGCYEDMSVRLNACFYVMEDGQEVATTVDSLSVWGVGVDSLLYNNDTASTLKLILNPKSDTTQYVIDAIQNGKSNVDTLTIIHTNNPWFQSLECGCMVFSKIKGVQVGGHIVKSASITDSSVINLDTEHVKLIL